MTARQDVEVNVEDGLPCPCAVVDYQAVALCVEAFLIGYLLRRKKKMADEFTVGFFHAVDLGNMPLGDHERMHGRLRIGVLESDHRVVLEYNL